MLWIPITLAASALQTVRNAAQRSLTGELSALGATYTRFLFGFPFAAIYAAILAALTHPVLAMPGLRFWALTSVAAVAQIIGTACLLRLFHLRNFSTGIVLSKSEILLTALVGLIALGDRLTWAAGLSIVAATAGLMILSHDDKAGGWHASLKGLAGAPAVYGLGTGACFAVGSVGFRAASLSLPGLDYLQSAAATLVTATLIQSLIMTAYLIWREPGQVSAVIRIWRRSIVPGLAGGAASACWFTAMTIEVAAYVRMLGLADVLFGYAVSTFRFKERAKARELFGSAILVIAIAVLIADRSGLLVKI